MPTKLMLALALSLAVAVHAVKIVATFPAYDVVLKEAFPQAEVILLAGGVADPHEYQLTAQDLELLRSLSPNDVVVNTMHAPFELKIAQMAEAGDIKAKVVDVTVLNTYLTWDGRETRLGGGQTEGGVNTHDHGLYPPNLLKLIDAVANATGLKPDPQFVEKLRQLDEQYRGEFSGKAVALTPAAQYILHWLGFKDVLVLVKEPGVPPTAEDLQKAIQYVEEGAPVVAIFVGDQNPRLVQMFTEKAKETGASPRIVEADFSTSYLSTLEKLVESLRQATAPLQNKSSQPAAPATAGTPGGSQPVLWAVVVLAAVVAVAILIRRRKE
ncbi:MAG: zinc ABC transporter substrate-binding protein [Pyrobaculum sp.]